MSYIQCINLFLSLLQLHKPETFEDVVDLIAGNPELAETFIVTQYILHRAIEFGKPEVEVLDFYLASAKSDPATIVVGVTLPLGELPIPNEITHVSTLGDFIRRYLQVHWTKTTLH